MISIETVYLMNPFFIQLQVQKKNSIKKLEKRINKNKYIREIQSSVKTSFVQ